MIQSFNKPLVKILNKIMLKVASGSGRRQEKEKVINGISATPFQAK